MGRKQTDPELGRYGLLVLFVMVQSPVAWSTFVSLHRLDHRKATEFLVSKVSDGLKSEDADGDCCRGIEHLELWGSEFNVNSSKACCLACKGMCSGGSGPCLCDSWLLPGCAPYSISYILDLLISHHCLGFHFYRAESREKSWDSEEMAIEEEIPTEACPPIRIGSVAGVESGPEFFISQANHDGIRH
ncbi:RNA-binding family protein [Salix suchowensis]|nr:RNA-binding family protein [Salix suchowensis]